MTLTEFLNYATTVAGVSVITGYAFSFLAEAFPGWATVDPRWKRYAMMALCFVVPVLATVGRGSYDEASLFAAVAAGFAAFTGSQVAHARKL